MKKHIICLFDENGLSAEPWAESNDYIVYCYDIAHKEESSKGNIVFVPWDVEDKACHNDMMFRHSGKVKMILSFPPCTDLAVSGAAWFKDKKKKNPWYREQALDMVMYARDAAEELGVPWVIENPVSVISTEWRKPDHIFHPYEYGGYLDEDDVHPMYPKYIAPRDAYTKKTCYWTGNGFKMPIAKPVKPEEGFSRQHRLLGGKSERTKRIRSASPRGIAKAIYEANK